MKPNLKKIILKPIDSKGYWLLLGLLFKGLICLFQVMSHGILILPNHHNHFIGSTGEDAQSYFIPIENFIRTGHYSPDDRMPGYGFVYYVFRLLFVKETACNLILLVQWLAAGLSVYYLAITVRDIFKKDGLFYITFFLFLLSPFSNYYDTWLQSDSLTTTSLIFASYFFIKYIKII